MVTVSSYALQILERAFPKGRQCLSKSYYRILFAGAMNRRLKASHVLLLPNFIRSAHSIENCGKNDTHQLFYSFVTTLHK